MADFLEILARPDEKIRKFWLRQNFTLGGPLSTKQKVGRLRRPDEKGGLRGVELEHAWEFLSDKQFLRSVQKRLPKVYLENIDPFAWESYKNGLAAEKRSKQMDISSMFNLDDIDEPEWANLNERIGDAVWNVDPD